MNAKRSGKRRRNIVTNIAMTLTLTFLTGCSFLTPTLKVQYDPTCDWFEDQQFSKKTKAWLAAQSPWPDFVRTDLNEVASNTDLSIENCPTIFRK